MGYYRDFREYLNRLEQLGMLRSIGAAVDSIKTATVETKRSLAFWPEDQQALVSLSEQGREDEAAQMLLSRGATLASQRGD